MRQNWLAAYAMVTRRGAAFLDEHARAADPFAEVGTRTVSVEVTSVVRASDRAFQVKWTETEFERGSIVGTTRWTAILAFVVRPPKSAETLRQNPLGLYVDGIDWARELETVAPPATTAPAARSDPTGLSFEPSLEAAPPVPERTTR
jgi:type IV secretion system protein VirB5